jgi:hypothetical protein
MPEELKRFGDEIERRTVADRREQGWHEELKEELTAHADRIETRLRRFYSRALGAFAVMGIACAVALVGFGVVLDAQKTTTQTIQSQRYDALLSNCLDTNVRHDNVIKRIDDAEKKVPKKKRDPQGLALFKGILEAAVPYTSDCRKFARDRLKGG